MNTSSLGLEVWESRWRALDASIESYEKSLKDDPKTSILKSMLVNLRKFAEEQFYFFHNGFATDNTPIKNSHRKYTLIQCNKYPPDYVLGVTLKQIAYDLEVIQRAAEQRIWAAQEENKHIQETLDRADCIAKAALEEAYKLDSISGNPPTVLTYFEKSPIVRCFPYTITNTDAGVALIAIPFTCVPHSGALTPDNVQDYVPILHELGHCVFWYGKTNDAEDKTIPIHKALNQALAYMKESTPWCYRWVEEIFADVFGCIIGGPVIALSAQDLAMVASEKEFTKDDGEHPIPAIRPIIYTNVLGRLNNGIPSQLTAELKKRWKTQQRERLQHKSETDKETQTSALPDEAYFEKGEFTVFEEESSQDSWQCTVKRVSFADAMREISTVITEIIKQVFNNDSSLKQIFSGFWGNGSFSTPIKDDTLENLYTLFQNRINEPVATKSLPTKVSTDGRTASFSVTPAQPPKGWEDWVRTNDYLDKPLSDYETGEAIPAIYERKEIKGRTGWLNILYAGGWATKGPTTNPSVK